MKIGRPKMTRKNYLEKYKEAISALKHGKSVRLVVKEQGISLSTAMRLKKELNISVKTVETLRPVKRRHIKRGPVGPRNIKESFKPIDKNLLNDWRELAPSIVALQKRGGNIGCQFFREIEDSDVAESLGVQEINTSNHGADGRKDGEILFEHKNKSEDNLDVSFADLSLPRAQQFCNGILTANTIWKGFLQKKYSLVFNSKNVGNLILDGQKNFRKTATIPFNTILKNGGKVIAWDGNIKEAWNEIQRLHPETELNMSDIYGPEDAKMVANMVMK